MTPVYYTNIVGGRFTSHKVRELLVVDRAVEVMIRDRQEYPPEGLHRHYRGRLVPMLTEYFNSCGADRPALQQGIHKSLCRWFLTRDAYCAATDGYKLETPSTRSLTRQQMQEFVHRIERWMIVDLDFDPKKMPSKGADFDLVV